MTIQATEIPSSALLYGHVERGEYADAFYTDITYSADLSEYIRAFYSSRVMRVERFILKFIGKPSSADQVEKLATGEISELAVWSVAERRKNEILLPDSYDRTCSWLMVSYPSTGKTRLHFGTGVHRMRQQGEGATSLNLFFRATIGFHLLYSKVLLRSARNQLEKLG